MNLPPKIEVLVNRMLAGDRFALSRLISIVDSRKYSRSLILKRINTKTGNSYLLGITGPPGAGKSTLINSIVKSYTTQGKRVGIIAVDPTSPFSGGAVLGDRIRMQEHIKNENIFIRSVGSRGSQGGLSRSTSELVKLFDAFGMDIVIIETVGVGQTELDLVSIADTVVVVLVPEAGDSIQTMKAGLMEIGDIFVVNKADREGAKKLASDIHKMIGSYHKGNSWEVPVLTTVAKQDLGIDELVGEIENHRQYQITNHILEMKQEKKREDEFINSLKEILDYKISKELENPEISKILMKIRKGDLDPYECAERLIKNIDVLNVEPEP